MRLNGVLDAAAIQRFALATVPEAAPGKAMGKP